jgi:hypothetical protein
MKFAQVRQAAGEPQSNNVSVLEVQTVRQRSVEALEHHSSSPPDCWLFFCPIPELGRFATVNPRFRRELPSAAAPQLQMDFQTCLIAAV